MNHRSSVLMPRRQIAAALVLATLCTLGLAGDGGAMARSRGSAAFLGAPPGVPVAWQDVPLPAVVVGPYNDPAVALASPFTPTFEQLVTRHSVIENLDQWRHVWRRLYHGVPFNPNLVTFDTHFVLLVGGGLQHPFFGFAINDVEETIGEFEPVMPFKEPAQEPALAVRVVLTYPGPPPPKMEYEWRVVAAAIPREHLEPIILNRQIFAAP
jgi:hypothetical protein